VDEQLESASYNRIMTNNLFDVIDTRRFLSGFWQKKPMFARGALPRQEQVYGPARPNAHAGAACSGASDLMQRV